MVFSGKSSTIKWVGWLGCSGDLHLPTPLPQSWVQRRHHRILSKSHAAFKNPGPSEQGTFTHFRTISTMTRGVIGTTYSWWPQTSKCMFDLTLLTPSGFFEGYIVSRHTVHAVGRCAASYQGAPHHLLVAGHGPATSGSKSPDAVDPNGLSKYSWCTGAQIANDRNI